MPQINRSMNISTWDMFHKKNNGVYLVILNNPKAYNAFANANVSVAIAVIPKARNPKFTCIVMIWKYFCLSIKYSAWMKFGCIRDTFNGIIISSKFGIYCVKMQKTIRKEMHAGNKKYEILISK